ncbi:NlpC/P60 family protein [Marininema halotolerans]|uniref:LysM domain-containing protein n=1 Tax=Marininema halotolerans TaxID=1155944 RepID=A0A1I6TJ70_9BACL|nr:NlpC/P60 family protein [Marininema halotolerans]SFS89206.1 LysM domain-containing protein [Marininema halotolerans]
MSVYPDKKVMTTLTVAGSLLVVSPQVADASANPEQTDTGSKETAYQVNQAVAVQESPSKWRYHVASTGIRAHVDEEGLEAGTYYIVRKGDTLSEIATRYQMHLEKLIQMNRQIKNPARIYIGQKIRILKGSKGSKESEEKASPDRKPSTEKPSSPYLGTGKGASIVNEAMRHLNASYVYGASGPNQFDCSGFTKYVYDKIVGKQLPRTSSAQASVGKFISKGNLRAGDLLFFRTGGGGISHVGIYMGGGKMIHASNPRDDINISNLGERYWSQRYVTARRVLR